MVPAQTLLSKSLVSSSIYLTAAVDSEDFIKRVNCKLSTCFILSLS